MVEDLHDLPHITSSRQTDNLLRMEWVDTQERSGLIWTLMWWNGDILTTLSTHSSTIDIFAHWLLHNVYITMTIRVIHTTCRTNLEPQAFYVFGTAFSNCGSANQHTVAGDHQSSPSRPNSDGDEETRLITCLSFNSRLSAPKSTGQSLLDFVDAHLRLILCKCHIPSRLPLHHAPLLSLFRPLVRLCTPF